MNAPVPPRLLNAPGIERKAPIGRSPSPPRPAASIRLADASDLILRSSAHDGEAVEGRLIDAQLVLPYRGLGEWTADSGAVLLDGNRMLLASCPTQFSVSQKTECEPHCCILLNWRGDLERMSTGIRFGAVRDMTLTMKLLVHRWRALLAEEAYDELQREELAMLTLREALDARPVRPMSSELVRRVKQYVHDRVAEQFTLGEVAGAIGVSPVYLTQSFSRSEGVPLYLYRRSIRLNLAMVALPGVDDITGLALDLGFSSHSYFSNCFRQFAGVTPSGFRKGLRA